MTEPISFIPSRVKNCAEGGHVAGAKDIIDDGSSITLDELVGNKEYNSANFSGMGRVVLKKNIVNGVNTLTQSMINQPNTIYIIQYDFTLGANITVPDNCILEFDGGSIANSIEKDYYIDGNNGSFNQDVSYKIFDNVIFKNFALEYIDIRWFGAKPAKIASEAIEDSAPYFQKAMDICVYYQCIPIKVIGIYRIKSTVVCRNHFQLFGNNYVTRAFHWRTVESTPESMIVVDDNITAFHILGNEAETDTMTYCSFNIHNIKFSGPSITENSAILFKVTTSGAPGRPCSFRQCEVVGFEKVFDFDYDEDCPGGTMVGTFSINECNIYACGSFIFTENTNKTTLGGLHIYDNVIEQGLGIAIKLYNPNGSIIISNNNFESNSDYCVYVYRDNESHVNVEINNSYLENQNKFVKFETINCQEWESNTGIKPSTLRLYNNFTIFTTGPSSAPSEINLSGVIIDELDDFCYYNNNSKFENCFFSKTVNIKNIPIECLSGGNVFEELPTENYPVFRTIGLSFKSSATYIASAENGEIKNELDLRHVSESSYTGTSVGDFCLCVVKIYGSVSIDFAYCGDDVFKYYYTPRPGYLIIKRNCVNPGGNIVFSMNVGGTKGRTKFISMSVTYIEKSMFSDINKVGEITVAKNVVLDSSSITNLNNTSHVIVYDITAKKHVYWNGTAWVDATGTAV